MRPFAVAALGGFSLVLGIGIGLLCAPVVRPAVREVIREQIVALLVEATPAVEPTATVPPTPPTPTPIPWVSPPKVPAVPAQPIPLARPQSVVPTPAEAEQIVRAFFDAVGKEDFDRLRTLTTGQARQQIEGLIREFQQAQQQYGSIDMVVRELAIERFQSQPDGTQVAATFAVDARVRVGGIVPVSRPVLRGKGVFLVQGERGRRAIGQITGDLGRGSG